MHDEQRLLRNLRFFCGVALIFTCAAIPSDAQNKGDYPKDGNGLIEACGAMIDLVDSPTSVLSLQGSALADKMGKLSWCLGYLQATQDILFTREINLAVIATTGVTLIGPDKEKAYAFDTLQVACIPYDASPLQLGRVLLKWLRDHPERLHEPPIILVLDSLKAAFPCKTSNAGAAKPK